MQILVKALFFSNIQEQNFKKEKPLEIFNMQPLLLTSLKGK